MSPKQFKQEIINHYMDQDGLVSPDRNPTRWSTGNGLLYTGLFYTICSILQETTDADTAHFQESVKRCYVEDHKGLLNRNPKRPDHESHDDYIGVVVASLLLGTRNKCDVWSYGKRNFWVFDNRLPERLFTLGAVSSWHGRFPLQLALYHYACSENPGIFLKLLARAALYLSTFEKKSNAEAWARNWLIVQALKKVGALKSAVHHWEIEFMRRYMSLSCCLQLAFGHQHPFAKAPI